MPTPCVLGSALVDHARSTKQLIPVPALSRGARSPKRTGAATSNRAGVVPATSPSSSSGSGEGAVDGEHGSAQHVDSRMADVTAAVELRRGRHEVELRDVADQHHVEEPVLRRRRWAQASSHRRASGRSRRSRRASGPGAPSPSHDTVTSVFFQRDEFPDERVVERRPAPSAFDIEFARRATAPLIPTDPTFAKIRLSSSPPGPRNTARPEIDLSRACPGARPRPLVEPGSGSRGCARSPARSRSGALRSPLRAGDPVHDLVERPVAADDDEQPPLVGDASRASSVRCPGGSESSASPSRPSSAARARSAGQRFAVEPFPLAGFTRKIAASRSARSYCLSAIATSSASSSSGRRTPSAPRR